MPVPRPHYSESDGLNRINSYAVKDEIEAIKVSVAGEHFCVASFAALLNYVANTYEADFGLNSLMVKVQATEGSC